MTPRTGPAAGSRWPALIVLCAGTLMTILDGTIVTVALPSIRSDLGFSQSSLAWVVNAYLITAADSGVVSGLANTTQQVGGALGVAVAAALATWRSNELLSAAAGPHSIAAALTAGYHLAFAAGAGLVAVALVVAVVVLRPRPAAPRPTPRTPADRPRDCAPDPETCVPAR